MLVAREGSSAPGTDPLLQFRSFSRVQFNNNGQLAFSGRLQGDGIGYGKGIWSEGGGNGLELVARTGDEAPDTGTGVIFSAFEIDGVLNDSGQVALMGSVSGLGVNSTNNHGIWAEDTNGELKLILRAGDLLNLSDDPSAPDLRTIQDLVLLANKNVLDEGSFESVGQLVFSARFTDGSQGIFISDLAPIPIPGDFDTDRDTDGGDFLAWQRGDSPAPLDAAELALWQQAFGGGQNLPVATSEAVPEPSSLLLLGLGGLLLSCCRGRQ